MLKYSFALVFPFVLILLFFGCSEKDAITQSTKVTEEQALKLAVIEVDSVAEFSSSDEISIDDEVMREPEYDDFATSMFAKPNLLDAVTDSIYPIRWGRHIQWSSITRDYQVLIQGDTLAYVTVTKTIPGEFIVGWGTRTADTVIIQDTVRKPFTETVQRRVLFRRIAHTDSARNNWRPIAVSMVQGKTLGVNAFTIVSLEVSDKNNLIDTTVIDPLSQWFRLGLFRGSVPKYPVGDSITIKLTVNSSDSTAEDVFARHGIAKGWSERRRAKMQLQSSAGNEGGYTRVYIRTFRAGLPARSSFARCNIIIDVLSHGTVFSRTSPFSNEYWGVPYIINRPR